MPDQREHNLVWMDLEMTGLCPEKDYVLEAAVMVTDNNLCTVAQGPSLVIHYPDSYLQNMSEWVCKTHTASGLLQAVRNSKISLSLAEQELLDFLRTHCLPGTSPLCGNSIWQDRSFLRLHMPKVNNFLHYRSIDVTAFKEVIKRWYPDNPKSIYQKKDGHRALDDIKESIEELRFYRDNFFVPLR